MGRFYESTAGRFIDDKMFEAPSQLMAQAIASKDKQVDSYIDKVDAFDPLLKIDALEQDTPRGREIIAQYHKRMNEITDAIQKNPLSFGKYGRDIKSLGRDIDSDFSSGEAYTINQYKKNVLNEYDKIGKLDAKDGYEADYKDREQNNILANYEGVNWNKEMGKAQGRPDIANSYHGLKFDDGFLAHMKADGYSYDIDTKSGGYIFTKKGSNETLSEQKLAEATYKYMNSDLAFQDAVGRRKQLNQGGFENADLSKAMVYDKDGKLIDLNNDYYGRKIATSFSYAYDKTSEGKEIKGDGIYTWAIDRQDKEKEKYAETPEVIYTEAMQRDAGNIKTFVKAIDIVNKELTRIGQDSAEVAKGLGIAVGTQAYTDIQNGNFASLQDKVNKGKLSEEKYTQIVSDYKRTNARKILLDAQSVSFNEYLDKKGYGGKVTKTLGWSYSKKDKNGKETNPFLQEYANYVKENGSGKPIKEINAVPITLSFNDMNVPLPLRTKFGKTFSEYFDNASFKVTGSDKGSEQVWETADGKKFIYTTDKTRRFFPNPDKNSNQKWIDAKHVESTQRSIGQLIEDNVVAKEDIKKGDKDASILNAAGEQGDGTSGYVTFRNGKSVGIVIDQSTTGLSSGYDNEGEINIGATVTLGNNRAVATISTKSLNSPTINQFINEHREEYEFNRLDNQTNWETLAPLSAKRKDKNGKEHIYTLVKGKAYQDGVLLGGSEDLKIVKRWVSGY